MSSVFNGKNEAINVDYWLKICDKYWPKLPLLKQAAVETRVSLKTGKGDRNVLKAKLQAIQQRIDEVNDEI